MSSLFRKKSLDQLMLESQTKRLSRSLNTFDLILLGIGCVVGAGVFVVAGVAAANDAGPAIIISFILAAIACALAAFCYAEFSSSIPVSGSVYTYSYATLGEFLAFLMGWDLMLEYVIALSAVASGWSSYFQSADSVFTYRRLYQLHLEPLTGPSLTFQAHSLFCLSPLSSQEASKKVQS